MELASYTSIVMMNDILDRSVKYKSLMKTLVPDASEKRPYVIPKAPEPYQSVAESFNMQGDELIAIIEDGLASENPSIHEAFARFIMLSKLHGGPSIQIYHAKIDRDRKTHERNEEQMHQRALESVRRQNTRPQGIIRELDAQINRRWVKQLDNFVLALERYNGTGELVGLDRSLFDSLNAAGYIRTLVEGARSEYALDYSAASCLSSSEVFTIINSL